MTIAVIGLGLIGGSFALAAKACGWRVVGIDKCPATLQLAAQHLDVVSDNVALINEADAVFVAVPMRQQIGKRLTKPWPRQNPRQFQNFHWRLRFGEHRHICYMVVVFVIITI